MEELALQSMDRGRSSIFPGQGEAGQYSMLRDFNRPRARSMKKSVVHLENFEIDAVAGTMGEGKEQVGNEAEGRH